MAAGFGVPDPRRHSPHLNARSLTMLIWIGRGRYIQLVLAAAVFALTLFISLKIDAEHGNSFASILPVSMPAMTLLVSIISILLQILNFFLLRTHIVLDVSILVLCILTLSILAEEYQLWAEFNNAIGVLEEQGNATIVPIPQGIINGLRDSVYLSGVQTMLALAMLVTSVMLQLYTSPSTQNDITTGSYLSA